MRARSLGKSERKNGGTPNGKRVDGAKTDGGARILEINSGAKIDTKPSEDRGWSAEQDKQLTDLKAADKDWTYIPEAVGKAPSECKQRFNEIRPRDWRANRAGQEAKTANETVADSPTGRETAQPNCRKMEHGRGDKRTSGDLVLEGDGVFSTQDVCLPATATDQTGLR